MDLATHKKLESWFNSARCITIMTGAGVSAESGISTFRDHNNSLWSRFDAQELASQSGFAKDPTTVWQWYQWRRQHILDAQPNPAHLALARLAERFSVSLITQNVDGLHQRAGSSDVIELHGNILRNKCNQPSCDYLTCKINVQSALTLCPECQSSWLRPDVVWFGETLDESSIESAQLAATECDLFLSIGTSSQVYPAAGFASLAQQSGARLIEINPNATALTRSVDWVIAAPAAETLYPFVQ